MALLGNYKKSRQFRITNRIVRPSGQSIKTLQLWVECANYFPSPVLLARLFTIDERQQKLEKAHPDF